MMRKHIKRLKQQLEEYRGTSCRHHPRGEWPTRTGPDLALEAVSFLAQMNDDGVWFTLSAAAPGNVRYSISLAKTRLRVDLSYCDRCPLRGLRWLLSTLWVSR